MTPCLRSGLEGYGLVSIIQLSMVGENMAIGYNACLDAIDTYAFGQMNGG
ncbi:predicted protein [Botrytis cinerea T4]|uniref:Uncharacterized protein n=1 Tax=Botryotinia fuckeliana (strain T4) TaxID=999810 RepID=G2Y351_BOTF4|nr:predicted protein [Botrytis cinerea T4]